MRWRVYLLMSAAIGVFALFYERLDVKRLAGMAVILLIYIAFKIEEKAE